MFCTNCGNRLEDGDVFCCECGAPVQADAATVDAEVPVRADAAAVDDGVQETSRSSEQQQTAGEPEVTQQTIASQPLYAQPQAQYAQPQAHYTQQPQYAQPQPQYAQPQYAQPQYAQPQYAQPQYAQPQPQYAQPQPQYAQPQYAQPQYAQPQYARPQRKIGGVIVFAALAILATITGVTVITTSIYRSFSVLGILYSIFYVVCIVVFFFVLKRKVPVLTFIPLALTTLMNLYSLTTNIGYGISWTALSFFSLLEILACILLLIFYIVGLASRGRAVAAKVFTIILSSALMLVLVIEGVVGIDYMSWSVEFYAYYALGLLSEIFLVIAMMIGVFKLKKVR